MGLFEPYRPPGSTFEPINNSFYFDDEVQRRLDDEDDSSKLDAFIQALGGFGGDVAKGAAAGLTFDTGFTGKAPEGFAGGLGRFLAEGVVMTGASLLLTPFVTAPLMASLGFRGAAGAARGIAKEGFMNAISRYGLLETGGGFLGATVPANTLAAGALSIGGTDEDSFTKNLLLFTAMDAVGLSLFAGAQRLLSKGATSSGLDLDTLARDAVEEGNVDKLTQLLNVLNNSELAVGDMLNKVQDIGGKSKVDLGFHVKKLFNISDQKEALLKQDIQAFDTELNLRFFDNPNLAKEAQEAVVDTIYKGLRANNALYTPLERDYIETLLHQKLDTKLFVDSKILAGTKAITKQHQDLAGIESVIKDFFKERLDVLPEGNQLGKILNDTVIQLDDFTRLTGVDATKGGTSIGQLTPRDFAEGGRKRLFGENKKAIDLTVDTIINKVNTIRRRTAVGLSPYVKEQGDYDKRLKDIHKYVERSVRRWMDDPKLQKLDSEFFTNLDTILLNKNRLKMTDEMSNVINLAKTMNVIAKAERTSTLAAAYRTSNEMIELRRQFHLKNVTPILHDILEEYDNIQASVVRRINNSIKFYDGVKKDLNAFNALINTAGNVTLMDSKDLIKFQRASLNVMAGEARETIRNPHFQGSISQNFFTEWQALGGDHRALIKAMVSNPQFEAEYMQKAGSHLFKKAFMGLKASYGDKAARRSFLSMTITDTPENTTAKMGLVSLVHDVDSMFTDVNGVPFDSVIGRLTSANLQNPAVHMLDVTNRFSGEKIMLNPDIGWIAKKFSTLSSTIENWTKRLDIMTTPETEAFAAPIKEIFNDAFGWHQQIGANRLKELANLREINTAYETMLARTKLLTPEKQKQLSELAPEVTLMERRLSKAGKADSDIAQEIQTRYLSKLDPEVRQIYDDFLELNKKHAMNLNQARDNLVVAKDVGLVPPDTKIPDRINIRPFHSPIIYDGDWIMMVKSGANSSGSIKIASQDELVTAAKALMQDGGLNGSDQVIIMPRFFNDDTEKFVMSEITDDLERQFGGSVEQWRNYLRKFKDAESDEVVAGIFSGSKQWKGQVESDGIQHFIKGSYMRAVQANRLAVHDVTLKGLGNIKNKIKQYDPTGRSFSNLIDSMDNLANDLLGRRGKLEGNLEGWWKRQMFRAASTNGTINMLVKSAKMSDVVTSVPRLMTRFTRFAMLGFNIKTAAVNSTTAFINVAPYVGIPETVQAMAQIAQRTWVKGKRVPVSKEWQFLREVGVGLDHAGFAHLDAGMETTAKFMKNWSTRRIEDFERVALAAFSTTEDWTHGVAALAARNRTLKSVQKYKDFKSGKKGIKLDEWDKDFLQFSRKLDLSPASDSAMVSWVRHQRNLITGNFDKAVMPESFRSGLLRPALQFKSFWNHQLQFLFGHDAFGTAGVGLAWKNPVKFFYSMGIMTAMGGALALPGMEIAELIGQGMFGMSPKLWMERTFSDTFMMGLPSLAGVDISQSLQFGDMLPISTGQLSPIEFTGGVFASKAHGFYKSIVENSDLLVQGVANRDSTILGEAFRKLNPNMPILWQHIFNDYHLLRHGAIPSAYEAGRPKVLADDIQGAFPKLAVLAGFPTVNEKKYVRMLKAVDLMNDHTRRERAEAYNLAYRLETAGRSLDATDILLNHNITRAQYDSWKTRATEGKDKSLESRIMLEDRDRLQDNLDELTGTDYKTEFEDLFGDLF